MKPLKIAGIALVLIVAILGTGIVIIVSRFDAPTIKAELIRIVQQRQQRTLTIDGDPELGFWPEIGVRLGRISLSERNSPQLFASANSARISVALLPLLSKRIVVNAIEINGARIALIRRQDGRLNIDAAPARERADETGRADQANDGARQSLRLDIAAIRIANAQVTWTDEKSGSSAALSGIDITTGAVHADSSGTSVAGLSLAAKAVVGADRFELSLKAPRLEFSPQKSGGDSATLIAHMTGPARELDAKLALSGIAGEGSALKLAKIALDLDGRSGDTAFKGRLDSAATVDLDRMNAALGNLSGEFSLTNPKLPMRQIAVPFSGGLQLDLSKRSAQGRLSARLGESKIALKIDPAKLSPPSLGFALDIDRIDLDRYLPATQAAQPAKPQQQAAGDGRLDLSILNDMVDLDGKVTIGDLQIARLKFRDLKLRLRAANGRLDLSPHSASLYGGTLAGSLALDARGNSVAAKETLSGIELGPLLKDAWGRDPIAGRGKLALDLAARGESVAAMKRSLAGTASLSLRDGALKGINLAQSFRELKAKLSNRQDSVRAASATEQTDFSELSASFRIARGVAHNDDLALKSPFLRLAGSGDIDIGRDSLDYLAQTSIVATAGGQGGADLEALKGLTIPVRITGPLDHPSYRIEFSALAAEAVKAKVEEKKQELRQKLKDELLKGLLGK